MWPHGLNINHEVFCDPMDSSPTGSPVRGISQIRILEWVAISFSEDFSNPGIKPASSALTGRFFTTGPPGKPRRKNSQRILEYTHTQYSTIKKNKILPFATTWRDQEVTMLTEISQTEKDKYYMLSLICGI